MKTWAILLAPLISLGLVNGCATLTESSDQKIIFKAPDTTGVSCRITTDDGKKWSFNELPAAIMIDKGKTPLTVVCKKPGFKRYKFTISPYFEGDVTQSLLLGGGLTLIFVAIDVASGRYWNYPPTVTMHMEPSRMSAKQRLDWLRGLGMEEAVIHCQRMECPREVMAKLLEGPSPVPVILPPEPAVDKKTKADSASQKIKEEAPGEETITTATGGAVAIPAGESAPMLPRPTVVTGILNDTPPGDVTAPVRIAVIPDFPEIGKGNHLILSGAYLNREQLRRLLVLLRENSIPAFLYEPDESGSPFTRIRIGPFLSREEAGKAVKLIEERIDIPLQTVPIR